MGNNLLLGRSVPEELETEIKLFCKGYLDPKFRDELWCAALDENGNRFESLFHRIGEVFRKPVRDINQHGQIRKEIAKLVVDTFRTFNTNIHPKTASQVKWFFRGESLQNELKAAQIILIRCLCEAQGVAHDGDMRMPYSSKKAHLLLHMVKVQVVVCLASGGNGSNLDCVKSVWEDHVEPDIRRASKDFMNNNSSLWAYYPESGSKTQAILKAL